MKVLVTGAAGQLGFDVVSELKSRGIACVGSDILPSFDKVSPYASMDITDQQQVNRVLEAEKPDAVIHCAAWTAVDAAEELENRERVYSINAQGTGHIARACRQLGCKMMYISTDYVFDGQGEAPWQPDCKDYAPLSVYGDSKLRGELAVASILENFFIVRIAWVFGKNGNNFVKTMLQIGKKYDTIRVVKDQVGTPTYTPDLARLLADMIQTDRYGCYHATNEGGYISWYEFACEIFRQAGYATHVLPVTTEEYGRNKAARPFNSRLDKTRLGENGFVPLPDWQDALGRYLQQLRLEELDTEG